MSHFPLTQPQSIGQQDHAAFAVRVNLIKQHSIGTTSATFVNPNEGDSVTVSVSSTTNIAVGDHVVIGQRYLQCTTPFTITSNPVVFTGIRNGSQVAGSTIPAGTFVVSSAGGTSSRSVTTTTGSPSVPDVTTGSTVSIVVASFANVVALTTAVLSTHTGTYVVTTVGSGNITVTKLARGDVPSGQTIPSGVTFATGILLGIANRTYNNMNYDRGQWGLTDCAVSCVSATTPGATQPLVGIGWSPAATTGRDAFSDCQSFNIASPSTFTAGTYRTAMTMPTQNVKRLAVPAGHAIMLRVGTSGNSAAHVGSIYVRGLYGIA